VSPGVPQVRQSGIARLDTRKVRHAVFQYDQPRFEAGIHIEGLDLLRSVTIQSEAPPVEPLPQVPPRAEFRVPGERVIAPAAGDGSPENIPEMVASFRNTLPLMKALGFNGVESYVRWGWIEHTQGEWDWAYYDAIFDEVERAGMQRFPMLPAGSGYALPAWLYDNPQKNFGFRCLEHGVMHDTQSIFFPEQTAYASDFIARFGQRYGGRKGLLGIRLGPSGDYGEAQYPARGPGYKFKDSHTHPGYWAGDSLAQADFRRAMQKSYPTIEALNHAWKSSFKSFDEVKTFLPLTAMTFRQRLDFDNWYMGAMSEWCEKWAIWSRKALPNASIHQSSGGWGFVEVGTDFTYQARSMAKLGGGIRLTNESDNFPDNFTITRMASSAARFYGAKLGYEPGGFGSARGVMARLYNALTTGAIHLFYYGGNITANDQAVNAWRKYGPLLDQRAKPLIDVAAFYPDTALKLDDDVLRYRFASAYFQKGRALRSRLDYDYASEQMILDGALDRYKVLVFLWGTVTEQKVLEKLDAWVRAGGTIIFSVQPRGGLTSVSEDASIFQRWQSGDTGKGKLIVYSGDSIPGEPYARFVAQELQKMTTLRPAISAALRIRKPADVYWSALENGKLALLNFSDDITTITLDGGRIVRLDPYAIVLR
ncbi:MAG: beta-galactosidase, partial [Acidobacteria bacterium]|nr:beta-galactosidase [Acidobacteriota bacterium]